MKNFNWEQFKKEKIAVHCNTIEKANDFLKHCEDNDITWLMGDSPISKTNWNFHGERTCYEYDSCGGSNIGLCYSSITFYEDEGYLTVQWEIEEDVQSDSTKSKSICPMEDNFGIKEGQEYIVTFETENGGGGSARGEIINFTSSKMVLKSKDGLYIISYRNIIELRPIIKKQ